MIIAGVDASGPRLITTDPSGSYRGYKAAALGMNSEKGRELLEKKYVDILQKIISLYNPPQLDAMPHVMFGGLVHEPALTLARRLAELL